jgi:zinc transport system substrate-binding protein
MHLWLDPANAKAMVAAIAEALIAADPDNSGIYTANARIMEHRLDQLAQEIAHDLGPVKDVPFVVFHDAFQYLDTAFGLNNVGSITVNPEQPPGAARLSEIHGKIAELQARCVFAEPQFEPRLVQVVIEGTAAKTATLDPLGAEIADGPELYFEMMRENAASLKACLGEAS